MRKKRRRGKTRPKIVAAYELRECWRECGHPRKARDCWSRCLKRAWNDV